MRFILSLLAAQVLAGGAGAADLTVTLPTVTATPGSTVQIPIEVSPNPSAFGVYSLDFRIDLDPAVIQSSSSLPDGFLQFWGTPFVNATSSLVAAATGGLQALSTNNTRLNTLMLTIKASAVLGTDMPLTFTTLRFNEGSPSVSVVNGILRIRGGAGVEPAWISGLALSAASPDPVRTRTRFAYTLPADGELALTIHGLDGRRVRMLATGTAAAGPHESHWDARDDTGRRVAAGVYFARLESRGQVVGRRLVVLP